MLTSGWLNVTLSKDDAATLQTKLVSIVTQAYPHVSSWDGVLRLASEIFQSTTMYSRMRHLVAAMSVRGPEIPPELPKLPAAEREWS